ncbi:ArsR/SmtB family transcription factor [Gordonia iterans]
MAHDGRPAADDGTTGSAQLTQAEVAHWASRFALLSDSTRLALLIEMHAVPDSAVSELAARVGITENAASQALRVLRDEGWAVADRSGRTVHYRIVHDAVVHRILHDVVGVGHLLTGQGH